MTEHVDPAALHGAGPAPAADTPDAADIPAFDPVPVRPRRDGWTVDRQRAFVEALARQGCVSDACEEVGISPRSAYKLRARPEGRGFAAAWDQAILVGMHRLLTAAIERAVYGTVRQIWHKGEIIGEERVPSERRLMFLLKHLDRARFGGIAGFTKVRVPDPRADAAAALPALLDTLEPSDIHAEAMTYADYQPKRHIVFDDR